MATEVERLVARLEVSQRQFERQLQQANRTARRQAGSIERTFKRANERISAGFGATGRAIRGALAISAGTLGTRQLIRYADAWTRVNNQIRAASQISGIQARATSELVDIANQSRAGLEETAVLYARLLRVSSQVGASEAEVAQITETLTRAFKAGGAAASEQAAAVLQLSQALGSGFLQGDELRSIRENAPLVAQAIAEEFDTTIGGLKALGAEGELTSDRVFQAVLNARQDIDAAFSQTIPTIADGLTAIQNGLIEVVAAFSDASGAGDNLAVSLQGIGQFLSDNVGQVQQFGARVAEAFTIIEEAYQGLTEFFQQDSITQNLDDVALNFEFVGRFIVDTLQTIIATAAGLGRAVAQAMLRSVAGVADGATAIVNAALGSIEFLLNEILQGIEGLLNPINNVIRAANGLGAGFPELPSIFGDVDLGRVESPFDANSRFRDGIADAFRSGFDEAQQGLQEFEETAIGVYTRIARAGEEFVSPDVNDPRGDQIAPPRDPDARSEFTPPERDSSGSGRDRESEIEKLREQIAVEQQQIRDKAALLGLERGELAKLEAQQKLLSEARRRGLDLDRAYGRTSETLREEIERQATVIGQLEVAYEQAANQQKFFEEVSTSLKDDIVDTVLGLESLSGALKSVAQAFARASIESALFNSGPLALGSGGGLLGGLFGAIPGFASGTDFAPGGLAVVGERGPELVNLPRGSQVIPNNRLAQASTVMVEVFVRDDGALGAIARTAGAQAALPVAVRVVEDNNRRVPSIVAEAQARA